MAGAATFSPGQSSCRFLFGWLEIWLVLSVASLFVQLWPRIARVWRELVPMTRVSLELAAGGTG
jgi:hypothetical protein